jgi:hypothetical protein
LSLNFEILCVLSVPAVKCNGNILATRWFKGTSRYRWCAVIIDRHSKIWRWVPGIVEIQFICVFARPIIVHDGEMKVNPNAPCGVTIIITGVTE